MLLKQLMCFLSFVVNVFIQVFLSFHLNTHYLNVGLCLSERWLDLIWKKWMRIKWYHSHVEENWKSQRENVLSIIQCMKNVEILNYEYSLRRSDFSNYTMYMYNLDAVRSLWLTKHKSEIVKYPLNWKFMRKLI